MAKFLEIDKAGFRQIAFSLSTALFLTAITSPFDKKVTVQSKQNKGRAAHIKPEKRRRRQTNGH
jgi:hypothetical protein